MCGHCLVSKRPCQLKVEMEHQNEISTQTIWDLES